MHLVSREAIKKARAISDAGHIEFFEFYFVAFTESQLQSPLAQSHAEH